MLPITRDPPSRVTVSEAERSTLRIDYSVRLGHIKAVERILTANPLLRVSSGAIMQETQNTPCTQMSTAGRTGQGSGALEIAAPAIGANSPPERKYAD